MISDFIHDFVPASSSRTLLLLHCTGGNERDFIPLGNDPIIPISKTKALDELLRNAGADVTIRYFQAGHELTMADVESARKWLTTLE